MSTDTVYKPAGATTLVGITAVQVQSLSANPGGTNTIRVRNLSTSQQWFTWGSQSTVTSLQPVAGTPAPNTIGMLPTSVETFEIPSNMWFIASAAGAFEMTPGQGP